MNPKKEKYQFINFLFGIFGRMIIASDSRHKNCHVYYRGVDISTKADMAIVPIDGERFGAVRFIRFGEKRMHPKYWKFGKVRWTLA